MHRPAGGEEMLCLGHGDESPWRGQPKHNRNFAARGSTVPAKQQETPAPTLALVGLLASPSAPKTQAGALRKQAGSRGKDSCTRFQLQNLIANLTAKPARFAEQLGAYEWKRGKKKQEKIGGSQEEETAHSPFPDLYRCCKCWRAQVILLKETDGLPPQSWGRW